MSIRKPADLRHGVPKGARVLALDLGRKTIGLALSDVEWRIATPYDTIRRTKLQRDLSIISQTIENEGVGAVVLGLPVNMDDSEGPRCQATRQFAKDLLAVIDIPLCLWDERLSTHVAEEALIAAGVTRSRRKTVIDKIAAAVILQSLLDRLRSQGDRLAGPPPP